MTGLKISRHILNKLEVKKKTNFYFVARFFPRFGSCLAPDTCIAMYFLRVLIGSLDNLVCCVITSVVFYDTQLKWYYDQKITSIFSSNFETLFTKHSPSEILSLNFDKKTVYLNCNFPI